MLRERAIVMNVPRCYNMYIMPSLRQELDIPLPDVEAYRTARRLFDAGWTPPDHDWSTDTQLSAVERRAALATVGREELWGISSAMLGGIGSQVDHQQVYELIDDNGKERLEPIDFTAWRGQPNQEAQLFRTLASGMVVTYFIPMTERIDEYTAHPDIGLSGMVARANHLIALQPDGSSAPTGNELESFLFGNLEEAGNFCAAILRIIPGLVQRTHGDMPADQRLELCNAIARGSEYFVRDMSVIPSNVSRYIGERCLGEGVPGLWDAIIMFSHAEPLLDYFTLTTAVDGQPQVAFSPKFIDHLKGKVADLKTTTNPVTGLPELAKGSWQGCPGIHTLDGEQLNVQMWQHHVALAPQIYEALLADS